MVGREGIGAFMAGREKHAWGLGHRFNFNLDVFYVL